MNMSMITMNLGKLDNTKSHLVLLLYSNFLFVFRCAKCEFCTKSEPEYRDHLKDEHNLTPEDLDDDQGIY